MRLSDFEYELPEELIAAEPLPERGASRLLVLDRRTGRTEHRLFRELPELLVPGDRLVVNDTRVVPARLYARREGHTGRIELLLLDPVGRSGGSVARAMVRPARKLEVGTVLRVGRDDLRVEVLEVLDERTRLIAFPPEVQVLQLLEREGHVPLPPYIRRPDTPQDRERYQTVYAAVPGAVAAPTAGLHFSPKILARLERAGIPVTTITLNVGVGTFAPVTEDDPRRHVMEAEEYNVPVRAANEINRTRRGGGRIVAVGTTVVRTLETAAALSGESGIWEARSGHGWTDTFIYPSHIFRLVDALITNFHLPRSTLLMLVTAFAGHRAVRRAYREAVEARYRFYSYGDAMLVE